MGKFSKIVRGKKTRRSAYYIVLAFGFAFVAWLSFGRSTSNDGAGKHPTTQAKLNNTAATAAQKQSFGIAIGPSLPGLQQSDRLILLKKIKTAGFTEVRYNVDWSLVEARKGKYDWAQADAIMLAVKQSGLNAIVTIDRTPTWARPAECTGDIFCAPGDMDAFASFSGLVAQRYKDYPVLAWEIWNEPNIQNFWKPLPNPNQYAHMLIAAYAEIKKQAPTAIVIVGGLSGDATDTIGTGFIDPRPFLAQLYAANAGKSFDGVGYHPYTSHHLPDYADDYNGWPKLDTGKNNIRGIMAANSDLSKKIWITEYGEATNGPGGVISDPSTKAASKGIDHVTQEAQDQITFAMLKLITQRDWIRNFDWYTYQDSATQPYNSGAFYGMLTASGEQKPVYKTLQDAMQATK